MSDAKTPPPKVHIEVRATIDGKTMSYYSQDDVDHERDVDLVLDEASSFITVNVWNDYHRIKKARENG